MSGTICTRYWQSSNYRSIAMRCAHTLPRTAEVALPLLMALPPSLDNRIRYVSTFFSPLLSFLFHLGTRRLDSLFVTHRDRSGCHLFQGKQVVRRAILGSSVVHRLLAAFDQNSLHSLTVSKENIVFNDFFIPTKNRDLTDYALWM